MANIGINALGLKSNAGGVETFIYNITKILVQKDGKNNYFLFIGRNNYNVFEDLKTFKNLKVITYPVNTNNSVNRIIFENTLLNLSCLKYKLKFIYHCCNYIPRFFFTKSIIMVHDLGGFFYHENFPEYKMMHNYYRYMRKKFNDTFSKAIKITVNSNYTKSQILKYYPFVKEDNITVIGCGLDTRIKKESFFEKETFFMNNKVDINKPIILSIAVLRPHKNLNFLIRVFNRLKKEYNIPHQLITIGGVQMEDFQFNIEIENSPYKDDIKNLGHLSFNDIDYVYKNSEIFVFPSLFEGFGIPLLEAMQYGLPIASSNAASLPEVGGNACKYFNPYDEEDALNVIYKLLKNKDEQQELKQYFNEKLQIYSWDNIADRLLNVFKTI